MNGGELLPPGLLDRLERLQLSTRRPLAGRFVGEHRSPRRGESIDFSDFRPYHPGDDFRRIDYHLLARLDVLLVKLYEADDELNVDLLVDTSASMGMDGKLDQAVRIAAAIGFVALVRRDPVRLQTFPRSGPAPRFTGRAGGPDLFRTLAGLRAAGRTTFAAAALHLLARPGPRGLVVVLSDLLTPEWEEGLRRLPARGSDLVVVHVLSPDELAPSLNGDLDLRDAEDGGRVSVSLSPETLREYGERLRTWTTRVRAAVSRTGGVYVPVSSTHDVEQLLLGSWRTAGVLR